MEVVATAAHRCQSKDTRWERVSWAQLIGWAQQSVTTSCGSALAGCCLNSVMEPINKDWVCARSCMGLREAAKQAAAGRAKSTSHPPAITDLRAAHFAQNKWWVPVHRKKTLLMEVWHSLPCSWLRPVSISLPPYLCGFLLNYRVEGEYNRWESSSLCVLLLHIFYIK